MRGFDTATEVAMLTSRQGEGERGFTGMHADFLRSGVRVDGGAARRCVVLAEARRRARKAGTR
jgi:hypothetical protein